MSNPHSIRLRLIGRCKSVCDHIAKQLVQKLRGAEVHSHAPLNLDHAGGIGVLNGRSKAEINNSVYASRLGQQINERCGLMRVYDLPFLLANQKLATTLNHHLIRHQNLPFEQAVKLACADEGVQS